jgi:uncharacterized protein YqhQ
MTPAPDEIPADASGNGSRPRLRLGGMALRNGLLIHGPTSWAVAARAPDGSIEVASGPRPVFARGRLASTPLLRGPLRLAEAMAIVPLARMRLPSARLPFEDPRVIATALATAAASRTIRGLGPEGESSVRSTAREALIAVLGALPALAALSDRNLAAYHGVEHKAIGAYERGSTDPTVAPKEHKRCGSNLIGPLVLCSIAGQVLIEQMLEEPGPVARGAVGVAGVGAAVELFAYADKNPGSLAGRAVHGPGHEIQRLVSTREPTADQLEVGRAALKEILEREAGPDEETEELGIA